MQQVVVRYISSELVYYRKNTAILLSVLTLDYLPASTAIYTITPITDLKEKMVKFSAVLDN